MKIIEIFFIAGGLFLLPLGSFAFTAKEVVSEKSITFPNPDAKATVLVFLSAKCPCSASHELTLKKLYETYSKEGFQFVGIHSNQDESEALTVSHFKQTKLPFPVVQDVGAKLADEWKALKTPHVFIVKKGETLFQGGVDDSADSNEAKEHYLEKALKEISMGKPVTVARVRTLGCAIKR